MTPIFICVFEKWNTDSIQIPINTWFLWMLWVFWNYSKVLFSPDINILFVNESSQYEMTICWKKQSVDEYSGFIIFCELQILCQLNFLTTLCYSDNVLTRVLLFGLVDEQQYQFVLTNLWIVGLVVNIHTKTILQHVVL